MSSANFFNGYACEKSTSRVLAPPGGRSSNIFGYDEPAAAPQQQRQGGQQNNGHHHQQQQNGQQAGQRPGDSAPEMSAQQQAAQNKQHQNGGINLFESVQSNGHTGQQHSAAQPIAADNSITQSHRGTGIKPKDNSFNDIFGEHAPQNANPGQQATKPGAIDRQKSSVFEDEHAKPAQQPSMGGTRQTNMNKPRSGYNTITGQTYESEQTQRESSAKAHVQQQAVDADVEATRKAGLHTSSRVLQPPGGRSTGLW